MRKIDGKLVGIYIFYWGFGSWSSVGRSLLTFAFHEGSKVRFKFEFQLLGSELKMWKAIWDHSYFCLGLYLLMQTCPIKNFWATHGYIHWPHLIWEGNLKINKTEARFKLHVFAWVLGPLHTTRVFVFWHQIFVFWHQIFRFSRFHIIFITKVSTYLGCKTRKPTHSV